NSAGFSTANEGVLTSPLIDLRTVAIAPVLSFNYLLQSEPGADWDDATIEVSTNGGASFEMVAGKNGGATRLTNDTRGSWSSAAVSLSNYVGSQILLRFHFNTVDGATNNYEGWYVDDVVVSGPAPGKVAITPISTSNFANGLWTGGIAVLNAATN